MIISASRRTDVPAFYADWFFQKLVEGYYYTYNKKINKYEKVLLKRNNLDCIIFWTKNPKPIMKYLDQITAMGYMYYFQFSITPYGNDIELNLGNKREILNTFKVLSDRIGADRVVWRYDPILINNKYTVDFHIKSFNQMCRSLSGYTNECVISFVDKFSKGTQLEYYEAPDVKDIDRIGSAFSKCAQKYNIQIKTCAEEIDLSKHGIGRSSCIDKEKIESLLNCRLSVGKDHSQRKECNCISSIDIGEYFSCLHRCSYCYAGGTDRVKCEYNHRNNFVDSPLFIGKPDINIKIKNKLNKSLICDEQISLI